MSSSFEGVQLLVHYVGLWELHIIKGNHWSEAWVLSSYVRLNKIEKLFIIINNYFWCYDYWKFVLQILETPFVGTFKKCKNTPLEGIASS